MANEPDPVIESERDPFRFGGEPRPASDAHLYPGGIGGDTPIRPDPLTVGFPDDPRKPTDPKGVEPFATEPQESFIANPLKLAPTGSGAGHVSRADFARSAVFGTSIYGLLEMVSPMLLQLLTSVGPDGHLFVRHGDLLATAFSASIAAAVAITHVVIAFMRDNKDGSQSTTDPIAPGRIP